MISHNLSLLSKLALGKCQTCGSFFDTGDVHSKYSKWNKISRVLEKAYDEEKGFVFWNWEVAKRKDKSGIKPLKRDTTYER